MGFKDTFYRYLPEVFRDNDESKHLEGYAKLIGHLLDIILAKIEEVEDIKDIDKFTDDIAREWLRGFDLAGIVDTLTEDFVKMLVRWIIRLYKMKGTWFAFETLLKFLFGPAVSYQIETLYQKIFKTVPHLSGIVRDSGEDWTVLDEGAPGLRNYYRDRRIQYFRAIEGEYKEGQNYDVYLENEGYGQLKFKDLSEMLLFAYVVDRDIYEDLCNLLNIDSTVIEKVIKFYEGDKKKAYLDSDFEEQLEGKWGYYFPNVVNSKIYKDLGDVYKLFGNEYSYGFYRVLIDLNKDISSVDFSFWDLLNNFVRLLQRFIPSYIRLVFRLGNLSVKDSYKSLYSFRYNTEGSFPFDSKVIFDSEFSPSTAKSLSDVIKESELSVKDLVRPKVVNIEDIKFDYLKNAGFSKMGFGMYIVEVEGLHIYKYLDNVWYET